MPFRPPEESPKPLVYDSSQPPEVAPWGGLIMPPGMSDSSLSALDANAYLQSVQPSNLAVDNSPGRMDGQDPTPGEHNLHWHTALQQNVQATSTRVEGNQVASQNLERSVGQTALNQNLSRGLGAVAAAGGSAFGALGKTLELVGKTIEGAGAGIEGLYGVRPKTKRGWQQLGAMAAALTLVAGSRYYHTSDHAAPPRNPDACASNQVPIVIGDEQAPGANNDIAKITETVNGELPAGAHTVTAADIRIWNGNLVNSAGKNIVYGEQCVTIVPPAPR